MSDEQSEYMFTLMPDRSIAVWHSGLQEPYILVRGSCSCPGATYRGWCKHQDWFRAGSIRPWNQGLTAGFFHTVKKECVMQEKPPFDCTLFCGPQYDGHFCANDCKHERWISRQSKSKQHDLELFVRRWTGHGVEINLDQMN